MSESPNNVLDLRAAFAATDHESIDEAARRIVQQYVNQPGRLPTVPDPIVEAALLVCRPGPGWSLTEAGAALRGEPPILYGVEPSHLANLRRLAERLITGERLTAQAMHDAAYTIMAAVRFAEVLDVFRRPGGELTVHVCPKVER